MTVTRGAPLRIDDLLDAAACAGLMGLASATVDGAPIGVVDLEGRLVIGERAGLIAARRHPIGLDGTLLGAIEAPEQVPEVGEGTHQDKALRPSAAGAGR